MVRNPAILIVSSTRMRQCSLALLAMICSIFFVLQSHSQESVRVSGEPQRISPVDDFFWMQPRWSPVANEMVATRANYRGLWILELGGDVREVTEAAAAGFGVSWSPDGESLLTRVANFDNRKRLNAVMVYDARSAEATQLTEFESRMPGNPQWISPGRVMLQYEQVMTFVDVRSPGGEDSQDSRMLVSFGDAIANVGEEDAAPRVVASESGKTVLNLVTSPDQSRVAFEVMGGNMFVMNADGTGRVDLGRGNRPRWSRDSQWITYAVSEDDGHDYTSSDIYAARADGSEIVQLTNTPNILEMNPDWSPDGKFIAYDDRGVIFVIPVTNN